ncbi:MAG: type II toxin-antitoxin system RatA family toxin [Gammaproteobacteria bacterium]
MPSVKHSALIGFSAEQMFDLVNDIEQYPKFLNSCKSARVISATDDELVGELCLAKAGISQCFTTKNILSRPDSIKLQLVKGDFSQLEGEWTFEALNESACRIELVMDFQFNSALLGYAAEKLLSSTIAGLVDAIVKRANEVYSQ